MNKKKKKKLKFEELKKLKFEEVEVEEKEGRKKGGFFLWNVLLLNFCDIFGFFDPFTFIVSLQGGPGQK